MADPAPWTSRLLLSHEILNASVKIFASSSRRIVEGISREVQQGHREVEIGRSLNLDFEFRGGFYPFVTESRRVIA